MTPRPPETRAALAPALLLAGAWLGGCAGADAPDPGAEAAATESAESSPDPAPDPASGEATEAVDPAAWTPATDAAAPESVPHDPSGYDEEALLAAMRAIPDDVAPDPDPERLLPGDPPDFPASRAIGGAPVEIVRELHPLTGTLLRIATVRVDDQVDETAQRVLHGPEWIYYDTGALRTRSWWRNDVRHGPIEQFRIVGTLDFEGRFEDGFLEGLRREYTKAGKLVEWALYRGGSRHGPYVRWYPNGQKKEQVRYVDGELDGVRRLWTRTGILTLQEGYEAGRRQGRHTEFDPASGEPRRWGDFDGGERTGLWSEAGPGGAIRATQRFEDGVRQGPFELRDPDSGRLVERSRFVDGAKSGPSETWYADGTPQAAGEYEGGARVGVWRYWRTDGSLNDSWSGVYEDDVRVGPLPGAEAPPGGSPASPRASDGATGGGD